VVLIACGSQEGSRFGIGIDYQDWFSSLLVCEDGNIGFLPDLFTMGIWFVQDQS
jgi:hypothetical protein